MQRRADGAGGLSYVYTFRESDGSDVRASCPASGPTSVVHAPAGATLVGEATDSGATFWAMDGVLVRALPLTIVGTAAPPPAAVALSAPAPPSWLLHLGVAMLAAVALLLAALLAGGAAPLITGASALPTPFPDPGARLLSAGRSLSLRALAALLTRGLVIGFTIAAATAAHVAVASSTLHALLTATLATLCAPPLAALAAGTGALAAGVGALAAATFGAALVAMATWNIVSLSLAAATAASAATWSCQRGGGLAKCLSALARGRLMPAMGRVFPQIPPTGHLHRRAKLRLASRREQTFIHRPNWRSRFSMLSEHCRLAGRHALGPSRLLLHLQLLLLLCLDFGACLLNLRVTPAGQPTEGPVATPSTAGLSDSARHLWRLARRNLLANLQAAGRLSVLLTWLVTAATVCLFLAVRSPSQWTRASARATDAIDAVAGHICPTALWRAALAVPHLPRVAADTVVAATHTGKRALVAALTRGLITAVCLAIRVRGVSRRIVQLASLTVTVALLRGELALRGKPSRPSVEVAPLPSAFAGKSVPTAVSSAVSGLVSDPFRSVAPVHSHPYLVSRGEALGGSHAACRAPEQPPAAPHSPPSPPPRRVGYALRRSAGVCARQSRMPAKTQLPAADGAWRSKFKIHRWAQLVIDSGCTWHVHNKLDELFNVRDCNDVVVDANGNEVECTKVGDLLVAVRDSRQRELRVWLRGVRYSPSFEDTLISVDQLWHASRIDSVFRDTRSLVCTKNVDSATNEALALPFRRHRGLFCWSVGVISGSDASHADLPATGVALGLKSGIHAAGSRSHVHALPADDVAALLHRRLHVSLDHLRRLGERSADTPAHIAAARELTCPICAEANSTRLPHGHSQYTPTHAGRLVHADIVGPFVSAFFGGHKYALILVDDHTRFKFVYFMKAKSEAPDKIRSFIASMNSHASLNSAAPIRVVGSLHTDNAGEFLSRKFTELLDEELVAQTTCPPHVHALNGVAERAISSVLALTRSYLTAGNVATTHWTHAVEMAVDVLNRTSGPAADGKDGPSSYELLTGEKPRVLGIMPFGCRAFAVKPREQYSKTTIDPRAWVGINLGRSARSPGAYKIFVPSAGRIVVTSDAYFMEGFFPMRPKGEQHDELAAPPTVPDDDAAAQPPGPPTRQAGAARSSVSTAFRDATRGGPPLSRRVLLLFSGPYDRPDGLAAFLRRRGIDVDLIDSGIEGGGGEHDILNDALFIKLHDKIRAGHYYAVFAAPPCSTYSVARFFRGDGDKGPPVVRDRNSILGVADVPKGHRRELHRANEITRRTTVLLAAAHRAGAEFAIENPADRGDPSHPWLFQVADHGPIWLDPHMLALRSACALQSATFAQCMFGADTQKYTTFWFTPGLSDCMQPLGNLACSHAPGSHAAGAGGLQHDDGTWNSAATAAYPADLNLFLAENFLSLRVTQESLDTSPVPADPTPPVAAPPAPRPPPPAPAPPAPVPSPAGPGDAPPDASPPTPTPAPSGETAGTPPASSEPADGDDAATPTDAPRRRRRRLLPHEYFQRGGGAIRTRSRGIASSAKAGPEDPSGHADAMRRDATGWGFQGAEGAEIDNHEKNESWRYELLSRKPANRQLVKLTWVFKVKRDGRKKARLCVQGCTQRPGVDYDQTFCAAMRGGSLRLLSSIGGRLGLSMRRWDFVAAYLQGELEPGEVTYCSPPPGYTTAEVDGRVRLVPIGQGDGVERMCVVTKPVYGMAQAGRRWQRSLFPWLTSWNAESGEDAPRLQQSVFDTCVFFCRHSTMTPSGRRDEIMLVGVYVDDLFVLSSHTDEHSLYARFTTDLAARWDVEDEGEVTDLLSVEIERRGDHIHLGQSKYIAKLMSTYAPDGTPSSSLGASYPLSAHPHGRTPAGEDLPQHVLTAVEQSADDVDRTLLRAYQSLVGALLYCAVNTRPDVAYAVGMLCRAMGKPTPDLYLDALRVLYYLHQHRDIGLRYGASDLDLSGMSDSDWAVRHSTTGYVFTYGLAAVSWGSKKQASVALSSCEAEIVALSEAAKEGAYLSEFLAELGFAGRSPLQLATDNSGARDLSYNPEHHDRVKHVERRHFYIRELVEERRVVVPFVSTHANMADFFTKPLSGKNFYRLRNAIMNVSSEDRARASLARRERRRTPASAPAACPSCGDARWVKGEPCYACELQHISDSPVCKRVRFDDSACDATVSAPVRRTGGCRESCVHTHVPTVSRVVAPSGHHGVIMP